MIPTQWAPAAGPFGHSERDIFNNPRHLYTALLLASTPNPDQRARCRMPGEGTREAGLNWPGLTLRQRILVNHAVLHDDSQVRFRLSHYAQVFQRITFHHQQIGTSAGDDLAHLPASPQQIRAIASGCA